MSGSGSIVDLAPSDEHEERDDSCAGETDPGR